MPNGRISDGLVQEGMSREMIARSVQFLRTLPVESYPDGKMELDFLVLGKKAYGRAYCKAEKFGENWHQTELYVVIDGQKYFVEK